MTTIALKDNVMVSDGQVSLGNRIDSYDQQKVFEVEGCLIGFCGRLSSALRFLKWFEDHMKSLVVQTSYPEVVVAMPDNLVDEDFQAIVVYPEGETYLFEGSERAFKIKQPYSIGSGSDYAIAAMRAGASAEEAINVTKDLDVYTGGHTFVVTLPKLEPEYTKEDLKKMSKEELLALVCPDEEGVETRDEETPSESKLAEAIKEKFKDDTLEEVPNENLKELGVTYNKTANVYCKGMVEFDYEGSAFKFTGTSSWFKFDDSTAKVMKSRLTLDELQGISESLGIKEVGTKATLIDYILEELDEWYEAINQVKDN